MAGKQYQAVKEKAPKETVALEEAVKFIKDNTRKSFNETVELHVHLGIDPTKSDQMVRGSVVLPAGAPKQKRVAVFTSSPATQAAVKEAGAAIAGGEELVEKVTKEGTLEADVVVATPEMMPKIARVARILGPKGLMPNPKTGTVTPKPAEVVKELLAGKLSFKMDQLGNIHEAIGKADWDADRIISNARAFVEAVRASRPSAARGEFLRSITLASTMGPGIQVSL